VNKKVQASVVVLSDRDAHMAIGTKMTIFDNQLAQSLGDKWWETYWQILYVSKI